MKRSLATAAVIAAIALAAFYRPAPVARADDKIHQLRVESAVDRGLSWLADTQEQGGSWGGSARGGGTSAITSLAVMAFMARGHVPGQGPYGEKLNKAIDNILNIQQPNGILASRLQQPMYDHGINTIMLCEAYGMLDPNRQKKARLVISRAVRAILDAQKIPKAPINQGGWRYTPTSVDSDTSVTGWQLMALRAVGNIGADVPPNAINAGIAYIEAHASVSGGFTYMGAGPITPALTGTGVLALVLMGKPDSPKAAAGGDYLLANYNTGQRQHFYYTAYYVSQAIWQLGGNYWSSISPDLQDALLKQQSATDGSFSTSVDNEGGAAYATSMAILALTVQYRYLPIYQK